MFSPETLTPVATTRQTTGGTPYSLVYGAEACLPRKPFWTPHGFSLLMDLCRNGYSARTWTLSTNVDGRRRPKMHIATRRSGVTTNGPCIVGSSGSGPSPTASTEPRRGPQSLPQLGRTLQGDGNMPTRGKPPCYSWSTSSQPLEHGASL
jgi:hypothetical protein